jgi:hypothetical protein
MLGVDRVQPSGTDWLMATCPLASSRHGSGEDRKPSLGISLGPGKSFVKCHACGVSGTMSTLIRQARKDGVITEETAETALAKCRWVEKHEPNIMADEDSDDGPAPPPALDPALVDLLSTWHPYFRYRNFSRREVMEWRLGAAKLWHRESQAERLAALLPCVLMDGTVPYVQGRFMKFKDFVWRPTPIQKQHVAGTHLFTGAERHIVVVEGIFDGMRTRRALRKLGWLPETGGTYGVAVLFGSKPNREQKAHLFSLVRDELIILSDADEAGDLASDELEEQGRKLVPKISRVWLPRGVDPDKAGTARVMELLAARRDLLTDRIRAMLHPSDKTNPLTFE